MSTAVLDIDFQNLPLEIVGLESYSKALILIRWKSKPIGQALLPVINGQIDGLELRDRLVDAAGWNLSEKWLYDYLDWDGTNTGKMALPKATVAVCTRDRPEDIKRCLDGLMQMPDDGQEFLIVDNCPSTDATEKLVKGYERVRYVRENIPGLDVARNRAMKEAQNEIVAFTDDDAVPDAGWLRALLRNFSDPLVLCTTGLTMPLELETEAQEWFEGHYPFGKGFRRIVFQSPQQHPLSTGQVGAGVNMALHRSVVDLVGEFDEALDAGTATCSGGDHEMFSRILAAGYRIVYDPAALCKHRHRRTWEELRRTFYGYGSGVYASWTRHLIVSGELSVLRLALGWFWHDQLPTLMRSLRRTPNSTPLYLVLAELQGCLAGPWAYIVSRRKLRNLPTTS